ncbi:hypothetical protein MSAN_01555500 [Mycena sanguinolenta]|uniref:Uncharacterized protein n=1 Tax=Mycena sanguinolenta TaxID=230812 RepID=A0A8H6XZK3_9AGAR|nr:hypothetical protein MSAN_01555500 [Mycena sanguinolenta]
MNLFHRNPEDSKTPSNSPPSSPSKRKLLFRSHSRGGSESGSPSKSSARPSAPESPPKRTPLGIANVANIFIRMRRASDQVKPRHIESSSGEDPQSHPDVLAGVTSTARKPLSHTDIFICDGAVNAGQLLRFTRRSLMEVAELIGANALVDEKWDCTILRPKPGRTNRTFKVRISYTASAALSERPDPHRPVALDKANSVPGLMTVVKRIAQS